GARLGRYGWQPILHHALAAAASRCEVHRLRPRGRGDGDRRSYSAVGCDSARTRVGWSAVRIEKGGDRRPLLLTGEVSLPFLAGLLLPALGFLRHCLLSPPSFGFRFARAPTTSLVTTASADSRGRRLAHRALAFARRSETRSD